MPPRTPPARLDTPRELVDLLIVGGLTVDHLADGSTMAGGTVLHGARAARAAGLRVGIVTVAGDELEARAGLAELADLAGPAALSVQHSPRSITFRHDDVDGVRTLTLLDPGEPMTAAPRVFRPRAVLYGPVAAELGPDFGGQWYDEVVTAALLQGWLRSLEPGRPVRALGLDQVGPEVVARLASSDLLVASTEDLVAVARRPDQQLDQLRRHVGERPILALTLGAAGSIVDVPDGRRMAVAPSRRLAPGSTIGAGDAFASVLVAGLAAGVSIRAAVEAATAAAAGYLGRASRRPNSR